MGITVNTILDLMMNVSVIQIYCNSYTYEFNIDELTDEIRYLPVHSIDDPYYYGHVHALCINIDADDLDDPDMFHKEYSDYEI